jgi:hypothetical protein
VRRSWIRLLAAAVALACVGAAHGASRDLNAYRGKVVYLDFWAEKRKDEYATHVQSLLGEPVAH